MKFYVALTEIFLECIRALIVMNLSIWFEPTVDTGGGSVTLQDRLLLWELMVLVWLTKDFVGFGGGSLLLLRVILEVFFDKVRGETGPRGVETCLYRLYPRGRDWAKGGFVLICEYVTLFI